MKLKAFHYALLGLGTGLIAILASIYLKYGLGLAISVTLSSLIYLLISKHWKRDKQAKPAKTGSKSLSHQPFFIVTVIITIFLLASPFLFTYERPLEYYIVIAFLSAVIAVEIELLDSRGSKLHLYNIILQILLLATIVRWSVLFSSPAFVGVDPWYHSLGVDHILQTGHVFVESDKQMYNFTIYPALAQYSSRPIMHILVAEIQLFASFSSLKDAFIFSVGIIEIFSLLFVFLVTRRILNDASGAALASLFVAMSNYHIMCGFDIVPMTLGLAFFSLLLWSLHQDQKSSNRHAMFGICLLIIVALIFTHSIAAFIGVIVLLIYWITKRKSNSSYINDKFFSLLPILAVVILAANWTLSHFTDEIVKSVLTLTTLNPMKPTVRNFAQFELDNIGLSILFFFAILGGLSWLGRLNKDKKSIILAASGLAIIAYGSGLIGFKATLPERWLAFLPVIFAPLAASGYYFLKRYSRKIRVILPLVILLFAFFMVVSSTSNIDMDNQIFYPATPLPRASFKESEIVAIQKAASISAGNLYMDLRYTELKYLLQKELLSIDFEHFQSESVDGLILYRRFVYIHNATLGTVLQNKFDLMNKVYSNYEVEMFLHTKNVSNP